MSAARRGAVLGGAALLGSALWWRANPSACPYSQRFWVEAPHPGITRARLREILRPEPGERLLEVGPGTGYYTLPVAGWLAPTGTLDILDIQPEMLEHTMRRARERAVSNVQAHLGDAHSLPLPDASFDGAYLITVLGEVPDKDQALRELRRVLRPGGRLVVGELFGDPHFVSHGSVVRRGGAAGLELERRLGGKLWHFTRLRAV